MKNKKIKNVMLASTAIAYLGLSGCASNFDKVTKYIDEANYEEALLVMADWNLSADDRSVLVSQIKVQLTDILDKYAFDQITYEKASAAIVTINSMNLSELDTDIAIIYAEIEVLHESKQAYTNGMTNYNNKNYLDAIDYFAQVIELDCNYDDALNKITEALNLYTDLVVSQARKMADNKEYEEAINLLNSKKMEMENSTEIDAQILLLQNEYESYLTQLAKNQAINEAQTYAKQENYEDALITLNFFEESYGVNDSEIKTMFDKYAEEYTLFIYDKAETLRINKKYLQALKMLENASLIVESVKFDSLITQINNEKPTYLCEVKCQNSDRYEQITEGEQLTDTLGNRYDVGNLFEISSQDGGWSDDRKGYAEYYLGYKYDILHGVISVDDQSENVDCNIYIDGDGVVLYSITLNRLTVPTTIDIDVSAVNVLAIRSGDVETGVFYTILSDFYFTK